MSEPRCIIAPMSEALQEDPDPDDARRLASVPVSGTGMSLHQMRAFLALLAQPITGLDGAATVEHLSVLEQVKGAVSAAQARLAVGLLTEQASQDAARKIAGEITIRSVGAQVGLARKESPARGVRFLRSARVLTDQMPHTMAALSDGRIGEYRAGLAVAGTSFLSPTDRRRLDTELGPVLDRLSDHETQAVVAGIAYRLDPQAAVAHTGAAESARRVTLRPAPDTMAILSALLPARAGVAIYSVLDAAAATARAAGDIRSRGQVMADTLLDRVTGARSADEVPMSVQLIVAEDTLAGEATPGRIAGYGPIPAPTTRRLADAPTSRIRRIRTRGGQIVATRPPLELHDSDHRTASSGQGTVADTSGATGNCSGTGQRQRQRQRTIQRGATETGDPAGSALPYSVLRRTDPAHTITSRPATCTGRPRSPTDKDSAKPATTAKSIPVGRPP